jgi:protein O-GlcNAc transferase
MNDLTRAATLWQSGKRLEAERAVLEVLQNRPEEPAALKSLAEIYGASGRPGEAIAIWRRLAEVAPADAGVLRRLAQALLAERQFGAATEVLHRAIALEPENARAHNNLGLARLRDGDAVGAVMSLHRAVALDPAYAIGHLNLGMALQHSGNAAGARASFDRALQIDPHLTPARVQLSALLHNADPSASRRERDRALESHAINLMTVRRHDDAIPVWTELIDGGADLHYLEGTRFHCRLHCCDWDHYDETAARIEADVLAGKPVVLPFSFFVHSNAVAAQRRAAEIFIADRYPPAPNLESHALFADAPRLKIAYVSFDFHEHATAYLIAGLFESHDRSRFEIIALSYGQSDGSSMRARLEASVERFIDVSRQSDREIADLMRSLGIHIAVDLKGFTGGARTGIFAFRPAPVQINFLGYPGTLGADYIDYLIADRQLVPEPDQIHYREKIIYMPQCYQPNDAQRPLPPAASSRFELGLPEQGFVFCSFNNLYKITPALFDIWLDLLREVAGSTLWLLEGTAAAARNLRTVAASRGIAPERLAFAPHIPLAQHLERYRHADLFLDTTPCNAHTTASDALWMGVPVLTVTGRTFAGRVATSLLHAVGLPELCMESVTDYAATALRLARTPAELAAFKLHLERGRHTFRLFDPKAYCGDLEAAYEAIWARHRRGEPPSALSVGALGPGYF